jgi:hypothetical protein
MTYGDILDMERQDRTWFLHRLHKQLKREERELEQASKGRR